MVEIITAKEARALSERSGQQVKNFYENIHQAAKTGQFETIVGFDLTRKTLTSSLPTRVTAAAQYLQKQGFTVEKEENYSSDTWWSFSVKW